MTKEITKANVIQEIQDKFNMREFESAPFLFSETVMPVYEIESHLAHEKSDMKDLSITASGEKSFFVVGESERWYLNRYVVIPMGAGAYTFAGVYITRRLTPTHFIYLDLTAAQTVAYAHDLPKPVVLEPGDRIKVNIDSFTSTQDLQVYIDYKMETIR